MRLLRRALLLVALLPALASLTACEHDHACLEIWHNTPDHRPPGTWRWSEASHMYYSQRQTGIHVEGFALYWHTDVWLPDYWCALRDPDNSPVEEPDGPQS
jgi:hypothetical protein